MAIIERDVSKAAASAFDLIIVGGGVYGVMLALEAGMRGQRALLLEKEDFGGATSLNHLRTVHGGLRYLQSLDLPRFFESVSERRWFLANFPALVQVLPCLMPLYGRGLKRSSIMGSAMLLNDSLGLARNAGVAPAKRLPRGRLVSRRFIIREFPQVQRQGLSSGALWYDAAMPEHQRLLMEILRWACSLGATALNYVRADSLLLQNGQLRGVLAHDIHGGRDLEFRAPVMVNAAGPSCRELAQKFDQDFPKLFRRRLLLFNILFRRKALSTHALALIPPNRPQRTYFIHNWQERMLAGTGEVLLATEAPGASPRPEDIAEFIADLNDTVPELALGENDIERVYSGILPASASGKLAAREAIVAHGDHQGPAGLYSVSGVKYTTARLVAEKAMRRIFPGTRAQRSPAPAAADSRRGFSAYEWTAAEAVSKAAADIRMMQAEEAVVHLDDLLFRRSGLGENRRRVMDMLPLLRPLFAWNDVRWLQECARVKDLLNAQP
jgi:glycerol-3-phosphate dehydrogenase